MLFKHIFSALSVENYSLITDIQNYYSTHNKCPSSEKEHEKCIFRLSYFHRIQPIHSETCFLQKIIHQNQEPLLLHMYPDGFVIIMILFGTVCYIHLRSVFKIYFRDTIASHRDYFDRRFINNQQGKVNGILFCKFL